MNDRDEHDGEIIVDQRRIRLSRRGFLTGSSAALATTGLVTISSAVIHDAAAAPPSQATPEATPQSAAVHPPAPESPPPVAFFNTHEAATTEALTARILPGTPEDPGAREAGVANYIDRTLSGTNFGFDLKTYDQGPFLVVSEAPTPVELTSRPDIYRTVEISSQDLANRYGYQSVLTPQEIYRRGLQAVDAYAQEKFKADFIDLSEADQDAIVTDMQSGDATGFDGPSGPAFFAQLRNDTIEGVFSDPMYGGNRDLVGWKLISYPGAQRFYTADMLQNGTDRQPQSLAQLLINEGH